MRILVTGATGFIGSHFVNLAMKAGNEVVAIQRSCNRKSRIPLAREPEWICTNLANIPESVFHRTDVVVHLAARGVSSQNDQVSELAIENVLLPLQFFEKAHRAGVRRYVIAGSCFEYGESASRYVAVPPNAPMEPLNPYAASKAAATLIFAAFARQTNSLLSILRIFHAYGEGEANTKLWPSLRAAALTGQDFPMTLGEQIRDFVPVEEVAKQLLDECFDDSIKEGHPKIRNCGTGSPQTVRDFCEYWWNQWQAKGELKIGALPYRKDEVMHYVPEIQNAGEQCR